ncbi:MAG: ABC transporter permease [Terriglobales bacterium]
MATRSSAVNEAAPAGRREAARGGFGRSVALPVASLWWREVVRFYRQRGRVVGVILSPVVFWLVIGSGFGSSVRYAGGGTEHYLEYFFPGALILVVLFTSIFTMMSVIEDRREGFLLSVLVAPVDRSVIVLSKVLSGTTLSAVQGMIFLAFAPAAGVRIGLQQLALVALIVFLVSFALTALGFTVAWRLDSAQAFHAIVNLFLIPMWLLSGALFPMSGASGWIRNLMRGNPLTYGVEALRAALFPGTAGETSTASALAILAAFSALMFAVAFWMASRRSTKPAA